MSEAMEVSLSTPVVGVKNRLKTVVVGIHEQEAESVSDFAELLIAWPVWALTRLGTAVDAILGLPSGIKSHLEKIASEADALSLEYPERRPYEPKRIHRPDVVGLGRAGRLARNDED
jgi:hypothetical protein